jgi:hypothetical protein
MRTGILTLALLALGELASAQTNADEPAPTQSAPPQEALTNRAIVTLAGAGFDEDFIIGVIANGKTKFDTSVSGLAGLAKEGINERIIGAMLKTPAVVPPAAGDSPPVIAAPAAPPDSDRKPHITLFKPKPIALAIVTQTPYYESTSLFWGLVTKTIAVGAPPPGREMLVPNPGPAAKTLRRVQYAQ